MRPAAPRFNVEREKGEKDSVSGEMGQAQWRRLDNKQPGAQYIAHKMIAAWFKQKKYLM